MRLYNISMGKRGPKPKSKVKISWSYDFAYGIGLMVTDGNLSNDGRHLSFVSKDKELVELFQQSLGIKDGYIKKEKSKIENSNFYYRFQFGDILFYKFLVSIGLTSNKSKTIGKVEIPDKYFIDFLRGHFDGDGSTYSYWDKRWKSSFMYYVSFTSASKKHIEWLKESIERMVGVKGHLSVNGKLMFYQLKFAKKEGFILFKKIYPKSRKCLYLERKKLKIDQTLAIVGKIL